MKQKQTHPISTKPASKSPVKKELKKPISNPVLLAPQMEKYGLWITLGLASLLILIIFHNFISGSVFYLFKDIGSDTINGWYPNLLSISRYLRTDGFPLWSNATGMGQNAMATSVTDPFSFIALAFGQENLAYGIIWMEISKILLTAILLVFFFRLWKITPGIIIIGSLLYCFGGFMMVGGAWFGFSTEAFFLVLLLFSFEKLYRDKQWYLFPLAVALIASNQPVNLYFYGLFLIFYFLFRHFSSDDPSWKNFGKLTLQMAGLTLFGLVLSSFFLVSQMQMLLDSPRVGGNSSHSAQLLSKPFLFVENSIYYATAISRLFSNDLLGNGSNFKGWYNYLEAPMWYIGLLPLLLMPQIFTLGSQRRKIAYGCLFLLFLIPVVFPYFRYAFWLFTGDYYRGYSVFVSLFFLFSAVDVLNEVVKGKKLNPYLLGASLLVLLALLYYPYESTAKAVNTGLRTVITNFLVIYAILLFLIRFEAYRSYIVIALVLVVFIEMGYMNSKTVNDRVALTDREKTEKTGYDDYTVEALAYIKSTDPQYYRVNKDYQSGPAIHSSLNDAKAQGYYGTMSYHSFNQKYYIRFLEEMNIIKKGEETQSRWSRGLVVNPLLQNLASTKYNLLKSPARQVVKLTYDSITTFGNVSVFKNRHFLPLGFTYDAYLPLSTFTKISAGLKEQIIQRAFVAEEPINQEITSLKQFDLRDSLVPYTFDRFFVDISNRKQDTLAITRFSENRIEGTIAPTTKKMLFFSIPFDKGWHARIDGKPVQPLLCNLGFMGFVLEPGKHSVELFYLPPWFNESLLMTIIALLLYLAGIAADHFYFKRKKKQVEHNYTSKVKNY